MPASASSLSELLLAQLRAHGDLDLDRCAVDGWHVRALNGATRSGPRGSTAGALAPRTTDLRRRRHPADRRPPQRRHPADPAGRRGAADPWPAGPAAPPTAVTTRDRGPEQSLDR